MNRSPATRYASSWSSPLARVRSHKAKLSIVIVAAVIITFVLATLGADLDWPGWIRPIVAVGLSLAMVQVLAHGTTSPLREMLTATKAMATGDYSQRVESTSSDEVGQLANAFNSMAGDLEEVERQRRELVANVSHELRTPIAVLQVNLENLIDGVTSADAASLGVMLRQTERLGRLVSQLLDLSKLESGATPIEVTNFGLGALANRVAEEFRLHQSSASIEIDIDEALKIEGDAERLHQVLANLIENAIRYAPANSPIIISAARRDHEVELVVADFGPGIPEEERSRVFERFHRVDDDRSVKKGGAGLGLAIVRWVVELHGGSIEAQPNEPTGCRMVVLLPNHL
ncbi:MAG: ATP-binding protein [Acidimicrobiales bacterium]